MQKAFHSRAPYPILTEIYASTKYQHFPMFRRGDIQKKRLRLNLGKAKS